MEIRRNQIIYLAYLLVFAAAAARLLPHPANFAPIAAIALFGAVYLNKKAAIWLPLAAMFVSDIFIGFDSLSSRLLVYGSFVLVGLIGFVVRKNKNLATIVGGSLAGSIMFYLITNFALFYPPVMYSHDFTGIMTSYVNALPFFRYTLLGDLFYTGVLFGTYEAALAWHKRQTTKELTQVIS